MGDRVDVDAGTLEHAVEALADCAELEQVRKELGGDMLMEVATALNARLRRSRVDLSARASDPWRWLLGAHLERFRERLGLELGVREMEWIDLSDVTPDDRPAEQLIVERLAMADAIDEAESAISETQPGGVEQWLRLPAPSVTYDLDRGLDRQAWGEQSRAVCDELKRATLAAVRECTGDHGWLYAVDEPEGANRCFRFWPNRADADMAWEVSPIPDGDDQVFVAQDFGWGMYATWSFDGSVDWALSLFGQPLLDSFARLRPRALSHVIRVDGRPV